jgi:hypothetical protein
MSSDHRESSGGSTVLIVFAILGGILLLGCCGGTVVIGSIFMIGTKAQDVQFQPVQAESIVRDLTQQEIEEAEAEAKKAADEFLEKQGK